MSRIRIIGLGLVALLALPELLDCSGSSGESPGRDASMEASSGDATAVEAMPDGDAKDGTLDQDDLQGDTGPDGDVADAGDEGAPAAGDGATSDGPTDGAPSLHSDAALDAGGTDADAAPALTCDAGDYPDGGVCVPIDWCARDHGGCDVTHGTCTSGALASVCACNVGYRGDGGTCASVCTVDNGGCPTNSTCHNAATATTGMTCDCNPGYARGGAKCLPVHDFYTLDKLPSSQMPCDDVSSAADLLAGLTGPAPFHNEAEVTAPIPFPFPFATFGVAHDRVNVQGNGVFRMLTPPQYPHLNFWTPAAIPSPINAGGGSVVADLLLPWSGTAIQPPPFAADGGSSNGTTVRAATFGTAPSRRLTIEVGTLPLLPLGDAGGGAVITFQVMFYETSNALEFHYCSASASAGNEPLIRGAESLIGFENYDATLGYPYSQSQDYAVSTDIYLRFALVQQPGPSCPPGYMDCDGNPANGCEANILADPQNCGACGTVCPSPGAGTPQTSTAACVFGACGLKCATGYADCNGVASDGCEVQTSGPDIHNCGQCFNLCDDGWGGHCNAPGTCN